MTISKIIQNRALKAFLLALTLVTMLTMPALAQIDDPRCYPILTPECPAPNVAPTNVERPASVLGNKITQKPAEVLPVTGGDAVGLAILAGVLIALGTAMNLRRKPKSKNA